MSFTRTTITSTIIADAVIETGIILDGGWGADTLEGTGSGDILRGGFGNDRLSGLAGDDLLYGGGGHDIISGGEGRDLLDGGSGNDVLQGGAGRDVLAGGTGKDTLIGGTEQDIFRWSHTAESRPGYANRDVIADFELIDRIDLSRIDANALADGDQAFHFIFGQAFVPGVEGQLRVARPLNSTINWVQGDINGDAVADFEIEVRGQLSTLQQFIL